MNKHLYKRVLVEQKTYPNAQEAIIDHIEMAITHAYINFEGADVEKLISKLQTCTFDILKAQEPVTTKKGNGLGAIRDYIILEGTGKSLEKIAQENIERQTILDFANPPVDNQLAKSAFDKDVLANILPTGTAEIEDKVLSMLVADIDIFGNRVINSFNNAGVITVRDMVALTVKEIIDIKGIGNSCILLVLKFLEQYWLTLDVGDAVKETKRRPKGGNKGMMNVVIN